MRLQKICLAILFYVLFLTVCLGQNAPEIVEGETWVNQYGIYYPTPSMVFRYDRYSQEDTVKFREKLGLLKDAKFADEWEGNYQSGFPDEVGTSVFRWDSGTGFVNYYFYSCLPELRYLNYGKITDTPEYIQTIPEFTTDTPRKEKPVKYVKVKWDKQFYLVEESSLLAFAEKAAGIYIEPDETSGEAFQKWSNHWVKSFEEDESGESPEIARRLSGLPEFPASYKKFLRLPIESKIISVGKRTIQSDVETASGITTAETAIYQVRLEIKKGIRKGMVFMIQGTNDEILVTQVNQNYAVGIIDRTIDENNNDQCYADNLEKIDCLKIIPALKIKTETGKFWF